MSTISRYSYGNFMPLSNAGELDPFRAKFRNLRTLIRPTKVILITEPFEGNLPGLAHIHLGDKGLWWALAYFNGLQDMLEDVSVGTVIRIPDKDQLISLLQSNVEQTAFLRL